MVMLIIVFVLGIIFGVLMMKSSKSLVEKIPIFGIGGDGIYVVSPNGLPNGLPNNNSKYRIRMKFKVDTENILGKMVLVSITNNRGGVIIGLNEEGNTLIIRTRGNEEFIVQPPLNDGNWHSLDFSIDSLTNIAINIDGKQQTVNQQQGGGTGTMIPISVVVGGVVSIKGYNTFQGKIKEVYFGDVFKTDMFYQYKTNAGNGGGEITYE